MNPYHPNLDYLRQAFEQGEELTFISSFPRSGNTWARHLIADVCEQNAGLETQTELPIHPDEIIPDVHSNPIASRTVLQNDRRLIVKSHDCLDQIVDQLGEGAFQRVRHLYLYRQPEDALVSYYHFHLRYDALKAQAADGVDAFCLRHLDSWFEHVDTARSFQLMGASVLPVSYEQLLQKPMAKLTEMLDWLGISATSDAVVSAVEHMQFSNLRQKEARNPANPTEYFFRKGVAGSGAAELSLEVVKEIRDRSEALLSSLQSAGTLERVSV